MLSILDTMRNDIYASLVSSDNTTIQEAPVVDSLIKESPVDDLPAPSTDVPCSFVTDVTTPVHRSRLQTVVTDYRTMVVRWSCRNRRLSYDLDSNMLPSLMTYRKAIVCDC